MTRTVINATLVCYHTPRDRARARLRARASKLVAPFFLTSWTLISAMATLHFFTWLEIVR